MVADLVFRQPVSPADLARAGRLLGGPRGPGETWFGLWSLTAAESDALVAIAATRRWSPRVVEVRAVKTSAGYAIRERLLREVADACRADGVEWLAYPI